MSGFQEHFLDKYFAYRRKYVDYVEREVPKRTKMAVLSEVARLSFVTFGSVLCAIVFLPLVVAAIARSGYVGAFVFAALALMSGWFATLAAGGLRSAWSDPRRLAASTVERERTR